MAMLLAPYNNSMRLGQGFNSFTQQICMTDAVTQGTHDVPSPYSEDQQPKGISQIVSYSSRFVDKLSDVTDLMNVSASLSIKTGTIGGAVSGTYIDSDKFKASDFNFFIQVKVTNQTHMARDYTQFQKLKSFPLTRFTEIYGDSFISGWEEGGELNALISVKVNDKSKITTIKDVNWSGGGQIKDPNVIWDINSLTLAAANFTDLVAMTPQRTYAILTKYTSLKSFHDTMGFFSPLDYENAGIYTGALLDAYMDYKSIWKHIQILNWKFESGTTELFKSEPTQELLTYAKECTKERESVPKPANQDTTLTHTIYEHPEGSEHSSDLQSKKPTFKPNVLLCEPYSPSIVGLSKARRDCRLEMTKIVHEVDAVTADPSIALQPDRVGIYLAPSIFRQLLPVNKSPQRSTGKVTPTLPSIYPEFDELRASISKHASRYEQFRLSGYLGDDLPQPGSVFFNSLDILEDTWMPKSITIYYDNYHLFGIKTIYNDGREILNGDDKGLQPTTVDLVAHEKIDGVKIESHSSLGMNSIAFIDSVTISSTVPGQPGPTINERTITPSKQSGSYVHSRDEKSPAEGWNLRGFYGSYSPGAGIQQLGLVWGKSA
ncbi:hypothetical protein COCVIDRAFT_22035 [Bipolaris victoriae FI3]|uniref:Uncharacterized protein n=1 Tax=Bipolaris victoriae (strain FI3) TaxID=930091 RepID=W7F088_BIPV3|nr:hypothetical protein COCVIDRAFT_22035 [Bipolaris victoriae FI3]